LNIAHFSWEYPPAIWGGLGTFALELTKKQVLNGNTVTVFAINNQNKMKIFNKCNGLEIYRPYILDLTSTLSIFSNDDLRSWGSNFKFFADVFNYNFQSASFFINDLVRKQNKKYDIIDGHDWLGILGGIVIKKEFILYWKHYVIQSLLATLSMTLVLLFLTFQNAVVVASIGATSFIIFATPYSCIIILSQQHPLAGFRLLIKANGKSPRRHRAPGTHYSAEVSRPDLSRLARHNPTLAVNSTSFFRLVSVLRI